MLDKFKKVLGIADAPKAEAEVVEPPVEASQEAQASAEVLQELNEVVNGSVQADAITELSTQFESFKLEAESKAAELLAQVAELTSALEVATAAKESLEAEKAEMLAKAAEAKLNARKEKIIAAIGTEKSEAVMLATEGLEDDKFEAVVSALAGSIDAEADSSLFKEQGVSAKADVAALEEKPAHFKTYIPKK